MTRATFKLADEKTQEAAAWVGAPPLALQQLWFAIQRLEWSSLVLVPAAPTASTLGVGRVLHEVGRLALGERLRLLDARGIKLEGTAPLILDMASAPSVRPADAQWSERVLVLIDSVLTQPSGVPITLAADGAILFVELGKTPVAAARETIHRVGPKRFLGCITLP